MSGLTFDAGPHTYTLDGVVVPSVTGILQASGLIDFSGIPTATLDAATAGDSRRCTLRGSTVHTAIHYLNEGDLDVDQRWR